MQGPVHQFDKYIKKDHIHHHGYNEEEPRHTSAGK